MGLWLSKLVGLFEEWATVEARILMLGLDCAGKTTLLYKMKMNEVVTTIPTIGFNVETVSPVKGLSFTVWDIGGQDKIRPLWRRYFEKSDGLIYVVDSADRERVSESRRELFSILDSDELRGVPVLVLANKQDLPGAMEVSELIEALNLRRLAGRKWHIQGTCATSGQGIYEGMNELSTMVKDMKIDRNR